MNVYKNQVTIFDNEYDLNSWLKVINYDIISINYNSNKFVVWYLKGFDESEIKKHIKR